MLTAHKSYMHDTAHTIPYHIHTYIHFQPIVMNSSKFLRFSLQLDCFFFLRQIVTHIKKENWSEKNSKVICVKRSYAKDLREIVCVGIDLALRRQ